MEKDDLGKLHSAKYEILTQKEYSGWVLTLDRIARRVIDVLVSFFGLLFSTPMFFVIRTIIKRDTPGPVFYHGDRVGKDGKNFKILKFRTMYEEPNCYNGKRLTVSSDPRVTKAGRWLRDSKMNELPQLWNVLLGQMSLVGPRPEDPEIFEDWPEKFKTQYKKVRPGVTSPASLIFFDEEDKISSTNTENDYLENILPFKLGIDFNYLSHRTVLNDLDTLFMTFIALFPRMRKERLKESTFDKGPLISFFYGFFNWFLIDFAVAGFATSISIFVWRLSMPLNIGFINALLLPFFVALGFSFTNVVFGLNRIAWRYAPGEAIMDVGISTALTTLIIGIISIVVPSLQIPLGIVLLTGVLSFIGFSMARYRERLLTGLATRWLRLRGEVEHVGERAIIIGAGDLGVQTSWYIKHGYMKRVLSVVGFVDDNIYKDNLIFDSSPVLGRVSDLPDLVDKNHVDVLIFAIENISKHRQRRIENICQKANAQFIHTRNLINDLNNFIGPNAGNQKLICSEEVLTVFLNQLDDCLNQEDLRRAQAIIKNMRQNLENPESDK